MNDQKEQAQRLAGYQTNRLQELILEMHDCCKEAMHFQARSFGLLQSELKCLLLFEGHKYLTGMEIAALLEVAKSRATVIIDNLDKKGFVSRVADPNDARVKLISLTPVGVKKVQEIEEFIFGLYFKLLNHINPAKRNEVIAALETLRSAMLSIQEMHKK